MDNTYRKLFTMIARAMELNSERVMEIDREKKDEKGLEAATKMRAEYGILHDNLEKINYNISKADCARLLVGCTVVISQLEGKIKSEQKALQGYKLDTLPKLQQIVEAADEETAQKLIMDLFITEEAK